MDNLTHSLVGLALAHSGLRRKTALATATLVIGANLPDVDALIYLVGDSTDALAFRRGWTHGILAMAAWPPLLAACMAMVHRWRPSRRADAVPLDGRWLLAAAAIGVWSHPILDWFNSYGVRLLMPFSSQWFYGDALFIIDPWVWALLAVGWIVSRRTTTPTGARRALRVAGWYVVAMIAASRYGVATVERQAGHPPALGTMVGPVPLWPHHREVIRDLGDTYETGTLTFRPAAAYQATGRRAVGLDSALAAAIRQTRQGANFLAWSRFPIAEQRVVGDSLLVTLGDVRYGTARTAGWATLVLALPMALSMDGIGGIRVGMTVADAERVLGPGRLERIEPADSCGQVTFATLPDGVSFMVMGDRIVRTDIHTDQVRTVRGLGIGSREAEVMAAFPGRVSVEEHPYERPEGHYLIVTDPRWPDHLMIFETSAGVVSSFRAGILPEVRLIEGCS